MGAERGVSEKVADPIRFVDRHTGRIEEEQIYGESFLRWTYGTWSGRLALEALAKRALFSRWYGWRMKRPASRARIAPFVKAYGLDPEESARPPGEYESFNAFFCRALRPGARPVADADVVFPADGRHLGIPELGAEDRIFVKGQRLDLAGLLGDRELAARYVGGAAILSRLCPVDYHRFHFPVGGTPGEAREIPGPLYSVSPLALRKRISIFWTNRRMLTLIQTENLGQVAMFEIGATCVGSIVQRFTPGVPVGKGDQKGWFEFGGSSTMMLFEPGKVRLSDDLVRTSAEGMELYARMGEAAAGRVPSETGDQG